MSALRSLALAILMISIPIARVPALAQGFSFSAAEKADKEAAQADADARKTKVESQLATPCLDKIKNQKIMVLLGENKGGTISAQQSAYESQYNTINRRLRALGLRTYTAEEIKKQVAQAEIDAYFKNNPDAAISASKRLAAQYILRGVIDARAVQNAMVNVNQVSVSLNFTLSSANGQTISEATAKNESYSGQDVLGMAQTLINERADEIVAQLYSDYCRKAGVK